MRFFFFKQKTAYEMRISDWSLDVCSSDLFEQGFRRLARQMLRQCQQAVLVSELYIGQPLRRHSVTEQLGLGSVRKQRRLSDKKRRYRRRLANLDDLRNHDLLNALANLHQLRRAGCGVRLQLSPLGHVIGLVVMIDVAEQQAGFRSEEPTSEIQSL